METIGLSRLANVIKYKVIDGILAKQNESRWNLGKVNYAAMVLRCEMKR